MLSTLIRHWYFYRLWGWVVCRMGSCSPAASPPPPASPPWSLPQSPLSFRPLPCQRYLLLLTHCPMAQGRWRLLPHSSLQAGAAWLPASQSLSDRRKRKREEEECGPLEPGWWWGGQFWSPLWNLLLLPMPLFVSGAAPSASCAASYETLRGGSWTTPGQKNISKSEFVPKTI